MALKITQPLQVKGTNDAIRIRQQRQKVIQDYQSGKYGNISQGQLANLIQGAKPAVNAQNYQQELTQTRPRNTLQQFTNPALGSFARGISGFGGQVASYVGTGVEAIPATRGIGKSIRSFGDNQVTGLNSFFEMGPYASGRAGENRALNVLGQGAGTIAQALLTRKIGTAIGGAKYGEIAGRAAPSVAFGLQSAGDATRDARSYGASPLRAFTSGTATGVTSAALEQIMPEGQGQVAKTFTGRILKSGAKEGLEEFSQSLATSVIADLGYKDVDYSDAVKQAVIEGLAGSVLGGAMQGTIDVGRLSGDLVSRGVPQQQAQTIAKKVSEQASRLDAERIYEQSKRNTLDAKDDVSYKFERLQIARESGNRRVVEARQREWKAAQRRYRIARTKEQIAKKNKDSGLGMSLKIVRDAENDGTGEVFRPAKNLRIARGESVSSYADSTTDPLESLKQEARKYKSAEEFVNSNLKVKSLQPTDGVQELAYGKYTGVKPNVADTHVEPLTSAIQRARKEADSTGNGAIGNYDVSQLKVKNGRVTVYHGTSSEVANNIRGFNDLQDGSYVSLTPGSNKEALGVYGAKHYADIADKFGKNGEVIKYEIPVEKLAVDKQTGELRYIGSKQQQLTDLYNQATQPKKKFGLTKLNEGGYISLDGKADQQNDNLIKSMRQGKINPNTGLPRQEGAGTTVVPDVPNMSEQTPPTLKDRKSEFMDLTNQYLGAQKSGEITASEIARAYNDKFGKLSEKQKNEVIFGKDDPFFTVTDPQAREAIDELKTIYDQEWKYFTEEKGLRLGYQQDYYPREYVNTKTGAEMSAAEYNLLQRGSARMKGRTANDLQEWKLKYRDPAEALMSYHKNLERASAGQKYLAELEAQGLVIKSTDYVSGMRPIVAEGIGTSDGMIYFARKDVADKLNTIFGAREASNVFEKALEKAQGFNSFVQSFTLSGGVPNTPINSFGIMQVMKSGMALHPIQGGKAFLMGMSRPNATKFFDNHAGYLKIAAENGLDIRYDTGLNPNKGAIKIKRAFDEKGALGAIGEGWNELTNDATFGRFMPALETLHFKGVYDGLIKRGVDPQQAGATAAQATMNFFGKNSMAKDATRSKVASDAMGAALFAPRFRESMVNFWAKNVQALKPSNITKVEYRDNVKFMVAAGAVFVAMDAINKALNGVHMWDNPEGKKDKLLIDGGDLTGGKYIGVPFLPSIATVPRNAAMAVFNTATGNFEEAGKNLKSFLSSPLQTGGEVLTNEDYFGSRVYNPDDPTATRLRDTGQYVVEDFMQPWVREAIKVKDQTPFETASKAAEAPLRFYDPAYFKGGSDNFNNPARSETIKLTGTLDERITSIKSDMKKQGYKTLDEYASDRGLPTGLSEKKLAAHASGSYDLYAEAYNFKPKTARNRFEEIEQQDDYIATARSMYDGSEKYATLPENVKQQFLSKNNLTPQDVEYDVFAHYSTKAKAQVIADSYSDRNQLLNALVQGRKRSISGSQFTNDATLRELRDMGAISDNEYKALRKYDDIDGAIRIKPSRGSTGRSGSSGASKAISIAKSALGASKPLTVRGSNVGSIKISDPGIGKRALRRNRA